MDFQVMYENIQSQITAKVNEINEKKQEISIMEAEVHKLNGAMEMLLIISKQLDEQKDPTSEEQSEPEKTTKTANKKTSKK